MCWLERWSWEGILLVNGPRFIHVTGVSHSPYFKILEGLVWVLLRSRLRNSPIVIAFVGSRSSSGKDWKVPRPKLTCSQRAGFNENLQLAWCDRCIWVCWMAFASVHAIWLFLFLCYFASSLSSKADICSHHRNLLSPMISVCKRVSISGAEDDQFLCFDAVQSVRETCLGTLGLAKCTSRLKCCWVDAKMIPQVNRKTRSSILYSFLVTLANFGKMAVWLRDQHGPAWCKWDLMVIVILSSEGLWQPFDVWGHEASKCCLWNRWKVSIKTCPQRGVPQTSLRAD